MRNPTIWESASRPLFVRTVWLEGSELRRGLQRYFLWDYETKRPVERLNTNNYYNFPRKTDTSDIKRSISLDLNGYKDFDDLNADVEDDFLVGSAKLKLHEPNNNKLMTNKKSKLFKYRNRSSIFNHRSTSYDNYQKDISRRQSDISDLHALKNSLTPDTADELLAERVLNWLDLAGKEDFLKNLNELQEMEVKLSKTSKLRQEAIKRYHNKTQNTTKSKSSKAKNMQRAATAATQTDNQINVKPSEAVKHITIIFNKEGQPIRLNRPAKNIDLCALSTSPGTTRRLAGSLASARLYKSADNPRCLNIPKTPYMKVKNGNDINHPLTTRRRLDTVGDLTNSTLQKRLHEQPNPSGYNRVLDSKKQLHIFMPTLPKKGINNNNGTDDGISELSHNFSELCRI